MKVQDVDESYCFYIGLGLCVFDVFFGMVIIEMWGGMYLLLFKKGDDQMVILLDSWSGQRFDFSSEKIDLMIGGYIKVDLELYRVSLIMKGYLLLVIVDGELYGYYYFLMQDLDGNGISVYISYCSDKFV